MSTNKNVAIATNGDAYTLDNKKKTAKKVFNSLKELKSIKKDLIKSTKHSFEAYVNYLRNELPDEPIKVDKNTFTIKGFRFIFETTGITCKDLFQYSQPVSFKKPPTPKDLLTFLRPQPNVRVFSSAEMSKAVEEGKKILEERKTVPVADLAKVTSTDSLKDAQKKALRLIARIKSKQASSKRMLEEIPSMIPFKPLNISIGLAIKYYREGSLRWGKFVERVERLIREETFEKRKAPVEKFMGGELLTFKTVSEIDYTKAVPCITVDGYEKEAGEWLVRYLLQKDKIPEMYVQFAQWVSGQITTKQLHFDKITKDKYVAWDWKIVRGLNKEQVEAIVDLFFHLEEFLPTRFLSNEDAKLKKGQRIKVYYYHTAELCEAIINSTVNGVWFTAISDGKSYPLFKDQHYKV